VKAVIQRVKAAEVRVGTEIVGQIGSGLVVLLGVAQGDTSAEVEYLCSKIVHLRIFPDGAGRMNRSLREVQGAVLLVSQFTLLGNTRKGRRPNFTAAAAPATARELYTEAARRFEGCGITVETGVFGAYMELSLTNDGPVTIILETPDA